MSDFSMLHFRLYVLLLILGISASPVIAQTTTSDTPLSERRVSYRMDVTLDPDARTVSGSQRLTWGNPDNVPVDELQFHLYLNAFRNNESTFMRESGGQHRGNSASDDNPWGGIEVRGMRIADDEGDFQPGLPSAPERDLTDRMTFIQPDDGNPDDLTVMSVALPQPVGPGEPLRLTSLLIVAFRKSSRAQDGRSLIQETLFSWWHNGFPKLLCMKYPVRGTFQKMP